MEDRVDFLKKVALFEGLSEEQLQKIAHVLEEKKISSGEAIMTEGQEGCSVYLLRAGEVEVVKTLTLKTRKGDFEEGEKSIVKLQADTVNFFGEMTLLSRAPRSATVRSVSNVDLYEIRTDAFDQLCREDADLGYKVMRALGARLSSVVDKNNRDIMKLTTALSLSLNKRK